MNLLISKGEVAAYKWGVDRITTAVVKVPVRQAARAYEQEYMQFQGPKMAENYQQTLKRFQREAAA